MKCAKPYLYKGSIPFGCGQCMSCRKNNARLKQHRIMLEAMKHQESCMVTLTYDNEHLPPGGSLCPKDLRDFLKRFRRALEPRRIRFYAVGEYGERNSRPHYHIAIFGFGHCLNRRTKSWTGKPCDCERCNLVREKWGKGGVDLGYTGITKDSAQYVAGYVTKKLTNRNDPKVQEILKGRHPEFARMSLKPGIGATVVDDIVRVLTSSHGCESIIRTGDVPVSVNHNGKSWPLGRYLRRKIREELGFYETGAQEGWEKQCYERAQEHLLELCIQEGVLGLIKKDEEKEADRVFKKMNPDWKKQIIENSNREFNVKLEEKEKTLKGKGRLL